MKFFKFCFQSINGKDGHLLGGSSVDPSIPDSDFIAPEEVDFDEAALRKSAKLKLSEFMSDTMVAGTVTDARQTAKLLLTHPVSSEAIIKLMQIIRDTMTNDESLRTVRLIQKLIRDILNDPVKVKQFFDDINDWFKDPESLVNVQRKDALVQYCMELTVKTKSLDNLTNAIRKLNYGNAPEVVDAMFQNFDFLVTLNPNLRIQDAAAYAVKKSFGRTKSFVGGKSATTEQ